MIRVATAIFLASLAAPLSAQDRGTTCDLAAVPKYDPATAGFQGATRDDTTVIMPKGLTPGCALALRREFSDPAARADVIARMGEIVRGYARSRGLPAERLVREPGRRSQDGIPVESWSIGPVRFAEIAFQELSGETAYVPAQGRTCLVIAPMRFREGVAPARVIASWDRQIERLIPACLKGIEPTAAAARIRTALARIDNAIDDAAAGWPAGHEPDELSTMAKAAAWRTVPEGWPPLVSEAPPVVTAKRENAPVLDPARSLAEGYLGSAIAVRREASGSAYWFANAKGIACRADVADRDGAPAAFMPDAAVLAAINAGCGTGAIDGLAMGLADAFAGADEGEVTITPSGALRTVRAMKPFKGFAARALAESHPASPLASVEFVPSTDRSEGFRARMVGRYLDGSRLLAVIPQSSSNDSEGCIADVPADRDALAAVEAACMEALRPGG